MSMMDEAKWVECDPVPEEGLVLLHSDDDGVEIYVHRSGRYAVRVTPAGGGWAYSIAAIIRGDLR